MGGRGRRRGRRGGGGGGGGGGGCGANGGGAGHRVRLPMKRGRSDAGGEPKRGAFIEIGDRRSAVLEEYYSTQGIVPEAEFPALLSALATPLPSSFRVTCDSRFRDDILRRLEVEFPPVFEAARKQAEADAAAAGGADAGGGSKKGSNADAAMRAAMDEPLQPPASLPWYPGGLGWSVATPRKMMRRDGRLAPFHKWLVRMNELGAVNRQEAVSMVPPLLIDLRPGQSVLDLCAAPGSKTAQLLEALQRSPPGENALSGSGLVVANDADIRRCWMLAHQLRRFGAPNLVVTHHDAQSFPSVTGFDRVLADVPCTGDGTLRKSPDIWRKWTPQLANGIHRLQKNILRRGIELLNPGGRLVYSTCSMNPVENEAIVADALRHFGPDVLALVDVSDQLPLLKRRSGLRTWKVKDTKLTEAELPQAAPVGGSDDVKSADLRSNPTASVGGPRTGTTNTGDDHGAVAESDLPAISRENGWFSSHDDVPEGRTRVVPSLFPPSAEELASGQFPLERCVRLVPQDQDTGAFFVAVLAKAETAKFSNKTSRMMSATEGQVVADPSAVVNEDVTASAVVASVDNKAIVENAVEASAEGATGTLPVATASGEGVGKGSKDKRGPKHSQHSRLITDDPLVGLNRANPAELLELSSFFGLDEAACRACFMTRGSEAHSYKKVLVVTPGVRSLLTKSVGSAEGDEAGVRGRLRVVNAGVRLFERTNRRDADPPFRILSDGIGVLRNSMQKRIVPGNMADLRLVLSRESTAVDSVSQRAQGAFGGLSPGSALMVCSDKEDEGNPDKEEVVLVWKGHHVITKLMPSDELAAIRSRHGIVEDSKVPPAKKASPSADVEDAKEDPVQTTLGGDPGKSLAAAISEGAPAEVMREEAGDVEAASEVLEGAHVS